MRVFGTKDLERGHVHVQLQSVSFPIHKLRFVRSTLEFVELQVLGLCCFSKKNGPRDRFLLSLQEGESWSLHSLRKSELQPQ